MPAPQDDTPPKPPAEPATTPSGGLAARLAEQTHGLVQDLTEWVDLRVQLIQIEVQEQIEAKANEVVRGGVVLVLGLVTLLFVLVTLALGLGVWLGHPAWGFLAVTGLLGLVTAFVRVRRPRLVRLDRPVPAAPSPPTALPDGTRKQLPTPPDPPSEHP